MPELSLLGSSALEGWDPLVAVALVAGLALALTWIATLTRFHRLGREFPELTPTTTTTTTTIATTSALAPDPSRVPPRISLVVAARDEEDHVEACIRSLLAQDHPDLELVFVDDRSSDRSPEILAELEAELAPRLRVLRVDALPSGWGGQTHGLHRGVEVSTGEWICFTDADCRFDSARALSIALADAEEHDAEFLSIIPRLEAPSVWERSYLPLCSFVLVTGLEIGKVNDPAHPAGYANGAFILIRRAAYERLGGHERVRQLVNDDVGLARAAKREGIRLRVTGNKGLLQTRMYESLSGAWRGWSRNLYGTLRHVPRLSAALLTTLTLFVLPWIVVIGLGIASCLNPAWLPALAAWGLALGIAQLGLWRLYAACELAPAWSLLSGLGAIFVSCLLANALGRSLRRSGTNWHGVHYPHPPTDLEEAAARGVQPGAE